MLALVLPGLAFIILLGIGVCGWLIFTERDDSAAGREALPAPGRKASAAHVRPAVVRKPAGRV